MDEVTLEDLPRVQRLRKAYFRARPEICIERARLLTQFHLDNCLFDQDAITILDKAKAYAHVLTVREPIIWHTHAYEKCEKGWHRFKCVDGSPFDESLFAGSTTSKFKGVPLYPEFTGLMSWPELYSVRCRTTNPYRITPDEAEELNLRIFPRWLHTSLMERARARDPSGFWLMQQLVFYFATKVACISHTIPSFSRAVHEGLGKIIEEAKQKVSTAQDSAKKEFYQAVAEALGGIVAYSGRLAAKARERAHDQPDPDRKAQLEELARIHERVPRRAARTFREGLTTIWLCWIALHLENANIALSLGRLDQLLYELYRADIQAGRLTVQEAVELLCCFWLKIGDHVPFMPEAGEHVFGGTGSNQAITIGGVDKNGNDAVNDLTFVILRSIELMKLRDPNLNARYMLGQNSDEYLRRLCLANVRTGATPAIHNDRAVVEALQRKGETKEQALDYGVVGCVEPCSSGRHYGHSGAVVLNLAAAVELALFDGRHRRTGLDQQISDRTGDPTTFESFDEFKQAFTRQVEWLAEEAVTMNNFLGGIHRDFQPTPILSALFEGPMDNGRDVVCGGATINSSGVAVLGFADVVDCLAAIRRVVFEDGDASFAELLEAIQCDFKGYEDLHARLTNPGRTPKFGNDDRPPPRSADDGTSADEIACWVAQMLDELFSGKRNYRGGGYRVGFWTMTMHAGFGRLTEALPNGRRDRDNFASGITPVSGVTPALTKTLNSVHSIPAQYLSNGAALNIKFTPQADEGEMVEEFAAVVQGFFKGPSDGDEGKAAPPFVEAPQGACRQPGGVEIQFNVVDAEALVDAFYDPQQHAELLVRVSGYTAYFKDLNQQMQKEIIDRTEYALVADAATLSERFPLPTERR